MRPLRTTDLTNTTPLDGRGRRTSATRLALDERDRFLIEAAKYYPGASGRETARCLRTALLRYQSGQWRRQRADLTCPANHAGKLTELLWALLKICDRVPSERSIRRAFRGPKPDG